VVTVGTQDVLSGLSIGHKRKFLQFLTGSERIPLGGIANLGFVMLFYILWQFVLTRSLF
jgi:hypothetical protein